jgi:hypothetical protein
MVIGAVAAVLLTAGCTRKAETPQPHRSLPAPPSLGTLYTMPTGGPQLTWQLLQVGDQQVRQDVQALTTAAGKALGNPVHSVMEKPQTPPSGDKHDYYSWSDYYWPNDPNDPKTQYERRDGQRVPDLDTLPDKINIRAMFADVNTLSLGYYLTGNKAYADKVAAHVRSWFLNPATKMNPDVRFAQFVRNRDTAETGSNGIIDVFNMPQVLDAVRLIEASQSLSSGEQSQLKAWFTQYLAWLTNSEHGRAEAAYANNRTTWYDAQVAAIAGYVGDGQTAATYARKGKDIVAAQVDSDGRQKAELKRTNSWDYSASNAQALLRLALAAKPNGVDLFAYTAPSGSSIRKALEYLLPYVMGRQWPGQNTHAVEPKLIQPALRIGAHIYRSADMTKADR